MGIATGLAGLVILLVTSSGPRAAPDRDPAVHTAATGMGPVQAGTAGAWWSGVQARIAGSEYAITWQPSTGIDDLPAAWQAPNRAQGFRTYFTDRGLRIVPRVPGGPSWSLGLAIDGPRRTILSPERDRITIDRGDLIEEYLNDTRGLHQRFAVQAPPPGAGTRGPGAFRSRPAGGPVRLPFTADGGIAPVVTPGGGSIEFLAPDGARILHAAGLLARDAAGRALAARAEAPDDGRRGFDLVIEDAGAAYPVTVDLLLAGAAWIVDGGQAGAGLGTSVATAGDVNGDGYSDIIVGAPEFDGGAADTGRVLLFHGTAAGPAPAPGWIFDGGQAGARLGAAVATAGDVDGDGFSEVLLGAPQDDAGAIDAGRVYLFHGAAEGLAPTPDWTFDGGQPDSALGSAVAPAGDIDGDTFSDIIIGAPGHDAGSPDAGRVFVFRGGPTGLTASPDWTFDGDQPGAGLGASISTAGDINGDGFAEIVIGVPRFDAAGIDTGRVLLFHGAETGLAAEPAWISDGGQAGAGLGTSVAAAGDVDGDGFADVIVGAPLFDSGPVETPVPDAGQAIVFHGSASGLAAVPAWTTEGWQAETGLGSSVATAGDFNGDGFADVVVGAPGFDTDLSDAGLVLVFRGAAAGLTSASDWAYGSQAGAGLGTAVAGAGDVDADGLSDFIAGAPRFDGGALDEGRVSLYSGAAATLAADPGWTRTGGQFHTYLGGAVAAAGDVNGDGFADVIVGASNFDNGQMSEGQALVFHGSSAGLQEVPAWTAESNQEAAYFGRVVSGAGDVNGDGYDDVIVGAPFYDSGQLDEGRVVVYHGSAAGLSPIADWVFDGNQAVPASTNRLEVAGAGDVNGDGFGDIIIGLPLRAYGEAEEGAAFIFLGSAAGLGSTPAWGADGDLAYAHFGDSVGTAGDVDADGYSDVIVGAPQFTNVQWREGRAYVYRGSPSGPAGSPDWMAEGDLTNGSFGSSVDTAGDVNGDGFADVIVGAARYFTGEYDEGRLFVYHGSAAGLSRAPDWTADGNQAFAALGGAVAGAGDVNGDGYSDVIGGADSYTNGESDEGRALLYHGSAAGLLRDPAWIAEGNNAGADFGLSLDTAGDVNGDGYADIIVGAPQYKTPVQTEGRVYLYYGNGGPGLALRPRQRRSDDSAPVAGLGVSDSEHAFLISLLGRTPYGRGRVRIEWEVEPLGSLLDGIGTTIGGTWIDTGPAGVDLLEAVTGLASGTVHHWRARLRYQPATSPLQVAGRWLTPAWNGPQETDLRTAGCPDADRDGVPSCGGDCDDADPLVQSVPGEVGEVTLFHDLATGTTTLAWGAPTEGGATAAMLYDVIESNDPADFLGGATCLLSDGGPETTATHGVDPAAGRIHYLLVRAATVCGHGPAGYASDGTPRLCRDCP